MITIANLRKMSETGEIKKQAIIKKKQSEEKMKQRFDDCKEAKKVILEAENALAKVAKMGERSFNVCVLRRGVHFTKRFDETKSTEFLGLIGKTIYDHFSTRGFKVSFLDWQDGMRMGESEDEAGYRVVISW